MDVSTIQKKWLGAVILLIAFSILFGITMARVGFMAALATWGSAIILTALIVVGVFLVLSSD